MTICTFISNFYFAEKRNDCTKYAEQRYSIVPFLVRIGVEHDLRQSRSQSPRSSVGGTVNWGGIVGLWENAEENQPLIGCLIISLTHSLLIEMRAILIIQEAKCKLVDLTRLFIALLTLRLHSTEQCIHKHNTNYTIEKYMQRNCTMQITCKHSTICS